MPKENIQKKSTLSYVPKKGLLRATFNPPVKSKEFFKITKAEHHIFDLKAKDRGIVSVDYQIAQFGPDLETAQGNFVESFQHVSALCGRVLINNLENPKLET